MGINCLKSINCLADDEAPTHRINLDGNTEYKSQLGGFCTITIFVAFSLVLIKEAIPVFKME